MVSIAGAPLRSHGRDASVPRAPTPGATVFADESFERLGSISVGHLCNLRNCALYLKQHVVLTETEPAKNTKTGVRKAHAPGRGQ
jgi:hypothetical protein